MAVLPVGVLVVRLLVQRPRLVFGGDQALIELGVRDAVGLHASVGVYSRFGWHHPGPVWLYLLAGPYRLLGGTSWALVVAELMLTAAATVLIVVAASRLADPTGGPPGVVVGWMAAGLLLVFSWMLGLAVLRGLWNPYAVVLPTVLFMLLAAGATAGRPGWGLGAALAGTFVVQTHVGTAALVGLTGLLVVVTRALVWVRRTVGARRLPRGALPTGRRRLVVGSGVAVLGLAWLPPLMDQISGTGNLQAVYAFVRQAKPSLGWVDSGSVVGQLLTRVYASRYPARLEALLPGSGGMTALLVVAGLAVGLLVAGWRRADAVAAAGGGVALAGLAGAVVGAHGIVGPKMPYLLLWTAALPVMLALGWAVLLAGSFRPGRGTVASLRVPAVVTTTAAAAMAVVAVQLPAVAGFPEPYLAQAAAELPRQLAGQGLAPQAILVRPCGAGRWQAAAGLVLELRRRGWPAYVPDALVPVFGARRRLPGRAHIELIVASHLTLPGVARLAGSRPLNASLGGSWGLYYRLSAPGFSGSTAPQPAGRGFGRITEACQRS